jgi:CheY-like chemotaxis protein
MARDILIVDDDRPALENFGNLIKVKLGIESFLADNGQEALAILRDYPIKVLVTDQEMPQLTGTELVGKMRDDLKLVVPSVMLTGHSDRLSVGEAINLGFFRFVDKMDVVSQLPQAVRDGIRSFDEDTMMRNVTTADIVVGNSRSWFRWKSTTKTILNRFSITQNVVHDADWRTELTANPNVQGVQEIRTTARVKTSADYGTEFSLMSKAGVTIRSILGAIDVGNNVNVGFDYRSSLEKEFQIELFKSIEVTELKTVTSQSGATLQSRQYQAAPAFNRVNCVLTTECSQCGVPRQFSIAIDIPNGSFALRQVEYFDSGPAKIIYTGFEPAIMPQDVR